MVKVVIFFSGKRTKKSCLRNANRNSPFGLCRVIIETNLAGITAEY